MPSVMPSQVKTRSTKTLKENIGVKEKCKSKVIGKAPRKVLGDKTNSASDENVSIELSTKSKQTVLEVLNEKKQVEKVRPRRDRRIPTRYVNNQVLTNLTNSKDGADVETPAPKIIITSHNSSESKSQNDEPNSSPFKTPSKLENSLVACRPKRISRLPSRFEDHSISPNKYIPIKPSNASTPIQQSKPKPSTKIDKCTVEKKPKTSETQETHKLDLKRLHKQPPRAAKKVALQKKICDSSTNNSSPDTNNNAKGRSLRGKNADKNQPSTKKSPDKLTTKKPIGKNLSFKVLEDNKKNTDGSNKSNLDVYEFTYDPDEEPQPQKKKRRKPVKRPPKPKTVVFTSNYDRNMTKAMLALKNIVTKKTATEHITVPTKKSETPQNVNKVPVEVSTKGSIPSSSNINKAYTTPANEKSIPVSNDTGATIQNSVHEVNYSSIRVEDIAADIEPSMVHHDINYSPVNSPRPITPNLGNNTQSPERPTNVNDPLNLQEDFSFDDNPVASSSMNTSVRHPLASPWRVEFGSLPIKWHVNTYVKPNMTPAVESSFISSSDSLKKKHVYTDMVPQVNDDLPEIVTNNSTNLKQTSIISFIREVAERKAKKKRERSVSPIKYNSLFEDVNNSINCDVQNKSKKQTTENVSNNSTNNSEDKENSKEAKKESRKRKNCGIVSDKPAKSPRKQKDKDCTYFGFDDSENQEQENVSPLKENNKKLRTLRPRMRPILQEVNSQTGPMRAALPVAAKSKIASSSEAVNKAYELTPGADAPVFPSKTTDGEHVTNIEDQTLNDDSQSVHLFEDIELIHHLKPSRKSYGKTKKVTFRQRSMSDSESPTSDVIEQNESSEEDDLANLTFEVPNIKEKKVTKKKKSKKMRSKKEEREAEEWAAGFNSMCEDIDEFPLVVE